MELANPFDSFYYESYEKQDSCLFINANIFIKPVVAIFRLY